MVNRVQSVNDKLDVHDVNGVYTSGEGVGVATSVHGPEAEKDKILLGLLESVERNGGQSQRHLASELGIALGLVNAYLKRCVKKGLVKVAEAPARRYAYYLTPQGFAEKSRLTIEYLSSSFSFFRQARADCAQTLATAQENGWSRIALAGKSDLAEIAVICAFERAITIVGVVDPDASATPFMGAPVVRSFDALPGTVDAILVTDLRAARATFEAAAAHFGRGRVLSPSLLGVRSEPLDSAEEIAP
jgi:DNA-binding MarR family transcriptional regulator